MIKLFCDKCGKEITDNVVKDCCNNIVTKFNKAAYHLCNECYERFNLLHLDISDFIKFNEKKLGFLESTFRVGDEVITSTGKIGKITDICTCERCRERGFYEPTVKMDNGETEDITISDKKNGFKYYYSIGDRVFGNIDEESVLEDITTTKSEIKQLQKELIELTTQLDVLKMLKRTDNVK